MLTSKNVLINISLFKCPVYLAFYANWEHCKEINIPIFQVEQTIRYHWQELAIRSS